MLPSRFLPADMVGQILNFGLPAPIDVQVVGNNLEGNRIYADTLACENEIRFRSNGSCGFSSPSMSRICA